MPTLSSVDQLQELRKLLALSNGEGKPTIVVCGGTACQAGGCNGVIRIAKRYIIEKRLRDKINLRVTGCHGFCEMGPFILTEPQRAFYTQVTLDDVPRIIEALLSGEYLENLLYHDPVTRELYFDRNEIPFFKNQRCDILGMNPKIDPIRITDYISVGGYAALERVLLDLSPKKVIADMKLSGLRGRGGGGFPTGTKWAMLAAQPDGRGKILVCNADEGDPGAYMDCSVLEGNPHSIIEGMIIGAYATSAAEGLIYIRSEYPLAIKHLTIAIAQAREYGLLGDNILGTGLSFDIRIVKGAGAFVCGEETAMIRSIEGGMGEPRQRPPYPVESGIHGKPTAINNVETWANVTLIFRSGADEFARTGCDRNSGTKIFSLVGKVKNTGLVEVPMGTPIHSIVHEIGGGPVGKAKVKAVQTGGPSGGCIPAGMFDLPIDYDTLAKVGSIMGSGGMIVMDENTCMVDVARYFMGFLKDESCGKCLTCRKGTQRMYEILDDIVTGKGTLAHLDLLEELALAVKDTTMCGLGQTAPNPVLSTLRHFRAEYERHITDKRCDAFVCKQLVGAPCQSGCPVGTEVWRYIAHIQRGEYEEAYKVIRASNPLPSICARVCHHPCEDACRAGVSGSEPMAIRALKRFVTDNVDPKVFKPAPVSMRRDKRVAVIGSGPAGLSAAHNLSMRGYKVTLYEKDTEPGGMLLAGIPAYRLPREMIRKDIASLMDGNVILKCNACLGRDITIDGLFKEGFASVFIATGAHKSQRLNTPGEDMEGVYPSMEFLKSFNVHGKSLAKGRVGIVGGGNSAVDAARVAIRQPGVESVQIIYRRTRGEMPAFEDEIEAALVEGVLLETLISPVKVHARKQDRRLPLEEEVSAAIQEGVSIEALASAVKIHSKAGRLTGLECIKNRLGDLDSSGRRKPVPIEGSEYVIPLDTLIVAIGEKPEVDGFESNGIEISGSGTIVVDTKTFMTSRTGVFAGGDAVSGPNTVVQALAVGRNAAAVIDRFLNGEELAQPGTTKLPEVYIEPVELEETQEDAVRARPPTLPVEARRQSCAEVEGCLSAKEAILEARRCMRCDLEFTTPKEHEPAGGAE